MPSISGALAAGGSDPDHRAEASLKKSRRFGAIASIKQNQRQTAKRQNELQRRVAGHIGGRVPLARRRGLAENAPFEAGGVK
jgi:hypothetical protein